MLLKTTTSLFRKKYQYKIVLVCPGAHWFRGTMEDTYEHLLKVDIFKKSTSNYRNTFIKTQEQLDYAFALQSTLSKFTDMDIRVESPWITIYTNNQQHLDTLVKLDPQNVKYICKPHANSNLSPGTVIMPKMNFDYKVTLGKTTQSHEAFVTWAEGSNKVKLTKSCRRDLLKNRTWGGTHFYVTGDNNLLLCKMHLGGGLAKLERIVKS